MSGNRPKTLKDITELIVDCEHKTAPKADCETGYLSIRTPNVGRGRLVLQGVNHVTHETYVKWTKRAVPRAGDLILAREAPVGNVAIVPANSTVCLGQRTVLIRPDRTQIDPDYLAYLLNGDEIQGKFWGYASGATVPHLNMSDIRSLELPELPPLPIQRRIAAILSAYDDLIENNTQRIRNLEAMAQMLYREWFVQFRYPGHESVPLVESDLGPIPSGWEVVTLGEVCDQVDGTIRTGPFGSQLHKSDYQDEGVPVVMPKNIIGWRVSTDGIARVGEEHVERLSQHKLKPGDIVYGRRGDIGRHALVSEREEGWLCGTGCLRISLGDAVLEPLFLHYHLTQDDVIEWIFNQAIGATMPNLNTKIIRSIPALKPPMELQREFVAIVAEDIALMENMRQRNEVLREVRDLLLPRLVSGELDVSALEIETGELDV